MNKGFIFLAFSVGAAIGSVVTWKLVKDKYKSIADEEIEDMKQYYNDRLEKLEYKEEDANRLTEAREKLSTYISELSYDGHDKEGDETVTKKPREIHVISYEDFVDCEYDEVISLTYYSNGVLTDDIGDPIDNPEAVVGPDALNSFGVYAEDGDDSVYVRDDDRKCLYEILYDTGAYEFA